MASKHGLRLASFDGGGARSISQLVILHRIMHRLRFEKYPNEPTKPVFPCEHFDMIVGSDTGGLITIMLTKLRLSVEDAIEEFCAVYEAVYKDAELTPVARSARLRSCMEDLLSRKGLPTDLKLAEGSPQEHCAGFVLATPRINMNHTIRLRTYGVRTEPSLDVTVIDAVMATCASQAAFAPVPLGSHYTRQEYGMAPNGSNPIRDIISEAYSVFGGDSTVTCLLSVGSGHPGIISVPSKSDSYTLFSVMQGVLLDCEKRAVEMQEQMGHLGIYFRLSVEQGMQKSQDLLDQKLSGIVTYTEAYLDTPITNDTLDACVERLVTSTGPVALNHLKYAGGLKAVYKGFPALATHYIRRVEIWKHLVASIESPDIGQKVIVITGMAGCGKTQLVADLMQEYDSSRSSQFSHTCFIDGSSDRSIRTDLISHVNAMSGGSTVDISSSLNFFQNPSNKRWLLVYDNVDDTKIDIAALLPECRHGTIVITTRNQLLRKLVSDRQLHLELDVMSEADAVDLVLRCARRHLPSEDEAKTASQIVSKLGYLPVALTQAGCYMADTKCSCDEYYELLAEHLTDLMEETSGDRQNQGAYAAFDLTYSRLSNQIQDLVHLLSCFHFTNFPLAIISHAAQHLFRNDPFPFTEQSDEFRDAIELLDKIFLPSGKWSKLVILNITRVLQTYSLASFTSTPATQLLRVHPLMREWAYARIPLERRVSFHAAAFRLLVCCTDATQLYPYLPSHIDATMLRSVPMEPSISIRAAFGKLLRLAGQQRRARTIWQNIYDHIRTEIGTDDLRIATIALELAATHDNGSLGSMETLELEAVRIRTAVLGAHHLDTLDAKSALYATFVRQGRRTEAVKLMQETLEALKAQLPPNHPEVLKASMVLSWVFVVAGRYPEAEIIDLQVLREQKARLGEGHLDTLDAMYALSRTYYHQARYRDAEVLQEKVVDGRKSQLGETHLQTLRAIAWLASIYREQGRHSQAAVLQNQALDSLKGQLGDSHSDTLDAMSNLALSYCGQGRYFEAEALQLKVLKGRKVLFGETHAVTVDAMVKLASTYYQQGRHHDLQPLQKRIQECKRA